MRGEEYVISMYMHIHCGSDMGGNAAGIFTELAILYVKYNEAKLMDHLRQFFSRMNIPRVIRECEVLLYVMPAHTRRHRTLRSSASECGVFEVLPCICEVCEVFEVLPCISHACTSC